MNPATDATRQTWQWSGKAAPHTASASSTGNENRRPDEADVLGKLFSRPTTRRQYGDAEESTNTTPGAFADDEQEEAKSAGNTNQVPKHNTTPGAFADDEEARSAGNRPENRHYGPRKCRICLEVVHPTFHPPAEGIAAMLNPAPVVEYISEDPDSGRFIRPCNCRGSMRWIHEGCLREWRRAGSSNFWQCPTCNFKYRLQRMDWSRAIGSKIMQITLTVFILFVTVFILGFIADPIINLYLDPYEVITSGGLNEPIIEDAGTWWEHLLKGLASLGVLGMIKGVIAMGPWQWLNIRNAGLFGGRRGGRAATGRDRMESISWWLIAFGVITFLWAVYKLVRAWSKRLLDTLGDRVADVQGNDDEDQEDDDEQD